MSTAPRVPPRTSHHADVPADELRARKAAAGVAVDVVIPARDEQSTVGDVVRAVVPLVDVGLVDDLVVVDSRSGDDTAAAARAAGARVVRQDEVVPSVAPGRGKGAAMWDGLAATDGDLVVFLDADLVGVGPHYVVGLLAPLLSTPSVRLVKGFYDRPFVREDGSEDVLGGGRVTELVARPLLNAFWPDLAWVLQPLGGEYAARRTTLEALELVEGYGVELAMLVEVARRDGVEAIAQVDLGVRRHGHQDLAALGRMSAQLLAVAVALLADEQRPAPGLADALWQPTHVDGRPALRHHAVEVHRRPRLASTRPTGGPVSA